MKNNIDMRKEMQELEDAMKESISVASTKFEIDIQQRKSHFRVIKAREGLFHRTQELLEYAETNRQQ